jgi:hypothetical protein
MNEQNKAKNDPKTPESKAAGKGADNIVQLIALLEERMQHFIDSEGVDANLTGKDRLRLTSAGVRNNGFIDKTFDIAHDNPEFLPPHFSIDQFTANIHRFEELRQLMLVLQQFQQMAANAFMQQADVCYRDALRVYGSLREQTRAKVPGAEPLFQALMTFFRRRRRPGAEPTEHELELDFKRLVHGKADGEIIVKNESPKMTEGVHKIVDDVHKNRAVIKESADVEVDE